MASIDDVPDLDDMTDLVQGIKLNKHPKLSTRSEAEDSIQSVGSVGESINKSVKKPIEKLNSSDKFGGMKKGFLFGGGKKVRQQQSGTKSSHIRSAQSDDIILPKYSSETQKNPLVFDEVQDVMKQSQKLDQSWLTGDLLKQVESNEKLSRQLADPRIAKAISLMQKDPTAAMEYYKNDSEIQTFFKEFYAILGNHFTQLGAEQKPPAASLEEEREMQDIISNPEIRAILVKPDIQKLIELLRNNPEEAQGHLNSSSDSFRADVNKLVSAGVLAFQQH